MKTRFELWQQVLVELGTRCSVSIAGDIDIVARRMEHEGDAFFDITLPKFGKDFERALAIGAIVEGLFVGYAKIKPGLMGFDPMLISPDIEAILEDFPADFTQNEFLAGKGSSGVRGQQAEAFLREVVRVNAHRAEDEVFEGEYRTAQMPVFLSGFMSKLFHVGSGLLIHKRDSFFPSTDRDDDIRPSVEETAYLVRSIRQLTLMFGKVEQECSPARNQAALDQYVETDNQIKEVMERLSQRPNFYNRDILPLKKVFQTVFGPALTQLDAIIYEGGLTPAHGPGATADRLSGNQKFRQSEWTERLEELFPYGDYALPNWRHAYALDDVNWLSPRDERPVKVVLVPKTASTPRVIAIEPTCMQYMQQAVSRELVRLLETDHRTKSFLGFSEQWPNQALAQIGSEDGSLATLDLSEASDRVPNWLVEDLLENWPHVSEAFQVTRSLRADVPGKGVIHLNKYASMGSALTFPVEAMVFLTIVLSAIVESDGKPVPWKSLKGLRDQVRVYGDDIIVPRDKAVTVMRSLEFFGFKVNSAKSFWTGGFRESCGKEFYMGEDVSIVRFRQELPRSLRDVQEIMSTVSTRNQLFQAGYTQTVVMLDEVMEKVLKGHYPYVAETSPVLGRLSPSGFYEVQKMSEGLQAPLVKGYVNSAKSPVNPLDGWYALLKCLLMEGGDEPSNTGEHLERSGRPRAASIKLVSASPF
jgi:hypothetical protein